MCIRDRWVSVGEEEELSRLWWCKVGRNFHILCGQINIVSLTIQLSFSLRVYVGKERFPHSVGSFLAVQLSLALWVVSGKRNDKLCPWTAVLIVVFILCAGSHLVSWMGRDWWCFRMGQALLHPCTRWGYQRLHVSSKWPSSSSVCQNIWWQDKPFLLVNLRVQWNWERRLTTWPHTSQ